MVKEIRISKKLLMCVGIRKGFGLGFSIDKWMLNIDLGIFWMALEW
jgi:hypothetical protein